MGTRQPNTRVPFPPLCPVPVCDASSAAARQERACKLRRALPDSLPMEGLEGCSPPPGGSGAGTHVARGLAEGWYTFSSYHGNGASASPNFGARVLPAACCLESTKGEAAAERAPHATVSKESYPTVGRPLHGSIFDPT